MGSEEWLLLFFWGVCVRGERTLTPIKNKCTGYGPIQGWDGVSGSDRYTVNNLMFYAQSAITVMSGRDRCTVAEDSLSNF